MSSSRAGIDVGQPDCHQRQGAPHPAVSPRPRSAVGSAARRAQDRHDVARHRAGLRRQDRAPRHPRRRPGGPGRRSNRTSATTSTRATGWSRTRPWTRRPCSTSCASMPSGCKPWVRDVSLMLAQAMRDGQSILFEGAQGTLLDIDHGTYPYVTSSNASIGGVCTGLGVPPEGDRRRARRRQGVHDARRRRAAADRADRRDGQPPARERQRVRRRHRPSAPLRLVRRGGRALRRRASTASTRSR